MGKSRVTLPSPSARVGRQRTPLWAERWRRGRSGHEGGGRAGTSGGRRLLGRAAADPGVGELGTGGIFVPRTLCVAASLASWQIEICDSDCGFVPRVMSEF